jgi:FKBP-type peptidyl-prolyl cis-trans isomerase FkpA
MSAMTGTICSSAVAMRKRMLALACLLAVAQPGWSQDIVARARALRGAMTLPSGVVVVPIQQGTGPSPAATSTVLISYTASSLRLGVFDSSSKYGKPLEIPLPRALKCWAIAIPAMKVGGRALVACPSALAYGPAGSGTTIAPNEALQFDIRLLAVTRP